MNKTKYVSPEVKILDMFDQRLEAWRISRPYLNPEDINLQDIERMDLAVGNACVYCFYVRSSILFRDLLFGLRPIAPWARSNRTIPFDTDNLFMSLEHDQYDEILQDKMKEVYEDLSNGIPQDYVKKKLPMAISTEFTFSIDDRSLVAFLKTLKIHAPFMYNVYGKLFLNSIGKDDSYVDNRRCKDIFYSMGLSDIEKGDIGKSEVFGEKLYTVFEASANLVSQVLRQHYSTVKTSLWNIVDEQPEDFYLTLSCNYDLTVALYTERSAFNNVIGVRGCWFAQFDKEDKSSWSSIIGNTIKNDTPEEFINRLPCKGDCNNCGILKDMLERVNVVESNPPCAILLEMPQLVELRKMKYESDSVVFKKYEESVGLIKDNPDNKYRKVYLDKLASKETDSHEWDIFKLHLLK